MKNLLKHTLKISIFFILFFSFYSIQAKNVELKIAKQVAKNIFSEKTGLSKNQLNIRNIQPIESNKETVFWIMNFSPKGFIIVSAEDNTEPILGYGLDSNFNMDDAPPGLLFLLDSFKEEIKIIKDKKLKGGDKVKKKWADYSSQNYTGLKSYSSGDWLLETEWNQNYPYNQYCPQISGGMSMFNGHAPVGCTAVALAQIVHHWGCRVYTENTASYYWQQQNLSVNFCEQNYDWEAMNPTSADDDNAMLLFHSGVSVEADYGPNATSASSSKAKIALQTYFGFNTNGLKYKNNFTNSEWVNKLKADIDAGRPIYYRGDNNGAAGHAWVVDGYDNNDYFHCNWGWGGSYNGFFSLTSLNPTSYYNLTFHQGAITGIEPILNNCPEISDTDEICHPTYSINNLPQGASVTWSCDNTNIHMVTDTESNTCKFIPVSNYYGTGIIEAEIIKNCGESFTTINKEVLVRGTPEIDVSDVIFSNDIGEEDFLCTSHVNNEFYIPDCDEQYFEIKLTDINETLTIDQFYNSGNDGFLDYSNLSEGFYLFWARGYNDCGWGDWVVTEVEYADCTLIEGGMYSMQISPNPTSDEAAIIINNKNKKAIDENEEWELEIYTQGQILKEKKTKLKGKEYKLKTNGWKEGVYVIKVKYKDYLLSEKLVVK